MELKTEKIESVKTYLSATTTEGYKLTALAQVDSQGKVTSLTGGTLTAPGQEMKATFDAFSRPGLNVFFIDDSESRSVLLDMIENFVTELFSRTFNLNAITNLQ